MFGAVKRSVGDAAEATEMAGVEHLGQYVFEMTQAKIKALKEGGDVLPVIEERTGQGEDSGDEGDVVDDDVPPEGEGADDIDENLI